MPREGNLQEFETIGVTMRTTALTMAVLLSLATVVQSDEPPEKRPAKIWNRTGPLGETPQHVTDAYPLSNQENQGGWIKFDALSDEFDGQDLDMKKWTRGLGWWKGRQPALFSDKNVTVSDGKLHLTMRKEKVPEEFEKLRLQGLHLGLLVLQGPCPLRLLRGQGQADELGGIQFVLVPGGRRSRLADGDRRI